jgi:classical protein kinase C
MRSARAAPHLAQRTKLKQIAQEFLHTDIDNSGDIDLNEVARALEKLDKPVNRAELKAAIRRVDDDDNGTLRYRE